MYTIAHIINSPERQNNVGSFKLAVDTAQLKDLLSFTVQAKISFDPASTKVVESTTTTIYMRGTCQKF